MRLALASIVAALALVAGVERAYACSCATPEPDRYLRQLDGAFVGTLLGLAALIARRRRAA